MISKIVDATIRTEYMYNVFEAFASSISYSIWYGLFKLSLGNVAFSKIYVTFSETAAEVDVSVRF